METYNNYISGVDSYEIHGNASAIALVFKGGDEVFVYEEKKLGKDHLQRMEDLAQKNDGLSRYISKNRDVRKGFSEMYANIDEYKKLYKPSIH